MKHPILALLVSLLPISAHAGAPTLQNGDLIFQTSQSAQSQMIQIATGSKYSHVGIVEVRSDGKQFVIEAISQVSETALDSWIARGEGGHYAVFRDADVTDDKGRALVAAAKRHLGESYNIYFSSHASGLYCSQLVDVAAKKVGLTIGHYQTLGSLNVRDPRVVGLMRARWQGHPLCHNLRSFEECLPKILDDELITPESLTEDSRVTKVFSNYPWW